MSKQSNQLMCNHIIQSYLELYAKMEIRKISMIDLARHADISRTTLYAHYDCIEAVISSIHGAYMGIDEQLTVPENKDGAIQVFQDNAIVAMKSIYYHRDFINDVEALTSPTLTNYINRNTSRILDLRRHNIAAYLGSNELAVPYDYALKMSVGLGKSVLEEWKASRYQESPERIAEITTKAFLSFIDSLVA